MLQLVWFKRDIRLFDHQAIHHAVATGEKVLFMYIAEPSIWQAGDLAKRHFTFMQQSLEDIQQSLRKIGGELYVAIGEMESILDDIYKMYGAFRMHSHYEHGIQPTFDRDLRVKRWMHEHTCLWTEYADFPVVRGKNAPRRRDFLKEWIKEPILAIPRQVFSLSTVPNALTNDLTILESLQVPGEERAIDIRGGEKEGIAYAKRFFEEKYMRYNINMNKPYVAPSSSSIISPYLTWGNISLKSLMRAVQKHMKHLKQTANPSEYDFLFEQLKSFQARLEWRSSFVQTVENFPMMHIRSLDSRFEGIRHQNPELLNAYIKGETGFPFLDACMRSLQQTGWINFKQRAMLATFGCNVLLLDWRVVGKVLAHAFTDYDPGIHWKQMQLQSGIDPKHHIPMHNVIKQGKENDPKGEFIKLYIPELRHLDNTNIHEPWSLEINPYITPIIDLKQSMDDHKKLLYGIKKNGHASE